MGDIWSHHHRHHDHGDSMKDAVDTAVETILREEAALVEKTLEDHRIWFLKVVEVLLDRESVTGEEILRLQENPQEAVSTIAACEVAS